MTHLVWTKKNDPLLIPGMWGFHDRELTLRKALHNTLQNSCGQSALWRRWRWHQTQANKQVIWIFGWILICDTEIKQVLEQ